MTRQAISPRFAIRILLNMALLPLRGSVRACPADPRGRSLLQECTDALDGLRRGANVGDALRRVLNELIRNRVMGDGLDQLLGCGLRLRAPGEKGLEDLTNFGVERVWFRHVVNETQFAGARCLDPLCREKIAARLSLSDRGNHVRTDRGWNDAEFHLRGRKHSPARRNGDVAG